MLFMGFNQGRSGAKTLPLVLQFLFCSLLIGAAKSHLHIGVPEGTSQQKSNEESSKHIVSQIRAYWKCYMSINTVPNGNGPKKTKEPTTYCPATFDGWGCWDATFGGETATILCPNMRTDDPAQKNVTKRCLPNGTWQVNPTTLEEVVDYKKCNLNVSEGDQDLLFQVIMEVSSLEKSPYAEPATGEAFEQCLVNVLAKPYVKSQKDESFCQRTFDGWGCWNDTAAGQTAYIPCPNFITGFLPERYAHKECNADGTWFRHPNNNHTWSNYTTCVDKEDLTFRTRINNIYIAGYSTSLVALGISLGIFCYFKSMQCTRITIHKNLFVSFIINDIMWILWYTEVVQNPQVIFANAIPCQILHVFVHYFLVSNYSWMFCEGLYLHTVLIVAFVAEAKLLKWFYLIGWGIPLIIICIYAAMRKTSQLPADTFYCWIEESGYSYIISGPVCISMLLNFFFLVNIVRVLVTKLRAVNSPDTHQTRKAVRATLILIPLLGLHYVVTPFRPLPKSPGEMIYENLSAIVTSFQGLMVALLFCFFNGEVIMHVRKKWNQTLLSRGRKMSYAATTVSNSHLSSSNGKALHLTKNLLSPR